MSHHWHFQIAESQENDREGLLLLTIKQIETEISLRI